MFRILSKILITKNYTTMKKLKQNHKGNKIKVILFSDNQSKRMLICDLQTFRSDLNREIIFLKQKIADLELQVRNKSEVNDDNSKLKQENAALIRIISKLSK